MIKYLFISTVTKRHILYNKLLIIEWKNNTQKKNNQVAPKFVSTKNLIDTFLCSCTQFHSENVARLSKI